jgi:pimeloyl-ACP methyl ester carboxylesterase
MRTEDVILGKKKIPTYVWGQGGKGTIVMAKEFFGEISGPHGLFDEIAIKALEENFRVVRIDYSDEVGENPISIQSRAEDIQAVVDRYREENTHILGYSLGATAVVAAELDDIASMTLMSGIYVFPGSRIQESSLRENRRRKFKRTLGGTTISLDLHSEFQTLDLEAQLRRIASPGLFFHSVQDPVVDFSQTERAAKLKGMDLSGERYSETRLIVGESHNYAGIHQEVSNQVAEFMNRFT